MSCGGGLRVRKGVHGLRGSGCLGARVFHSASLLIVFFVRS